jgi:AraC-like DNA-binding protein
LVSIYGFNQYIVFHSSAVTRISTNFINAGFVPYLIGPSIYLYVRSVLRDDHRPHKKDILHLLPALIFLAISLLNRYIPWENKEQMAQNFIVSIENHGITRTATIGNKFLVAAIFIIPTLIILGYILWSCIILISYLNHKKIQQVFISQQSAIQWIKAFLGIEVLLITGHLIMVIKIFGFENQNGFASYNAFQNILGLGPVAIIILIFFSPGILYGLPRLPGNNMELINSEKSTEPEQSWNKIQTPRFESGYLQSIGKKADACMEELKPYVKADFNKNELSLLIQVPTHHITYFFREVKKQSFVDYRTEWRVKHAKKLMKEGKSAKMTLEAIGLLSGFPNRDSFRIAFQRAEGVTPALFAEKESNEFL